MQGKCASSPAHRNSVIVVWLQHLAAYSLEKSQGVDRHTFNAIVQPLDLYDTYLPAFRACVEIGRVQQVMCRLVAEGVALSDHL